MLARDGHALVRVVAAASGADGEDGEPRAETLARVAARVGESKSSARAVPAEQLGAIGAATALVQTIVAGELLRRGALPGPRALCVSTGAPGLAAAVGIEVAS